MTQKRGHLDHTHHRGPHRKFSKSSHHNDTKNANPQLQVTSRSVEDKLSELDVRLPQKTLSGGSFLSYSASVNQPKLLATPTHLPPLPPIAAPLSEAPFRHASKSDEKYGGKLTYDRLEFLGDAYLEVFATRLIYSRFPRLAIGKLSSLRERLVRNSTLAGFAKGYGFDKRIDMDRIQEKRFLNFEAGGGHNDQGKMKGQAHTPEKMMADVFEAYVAAVVLSDEADGVTNAEAWLTSLWVDILLDADQDTTLAMVQNRKDELARLISGKEAKIDYEVDRANAGIANPGATRMHDVAVYVTGWGYEKKKLGQGQGVSVKEAGMRAAADALDNNREVVDQIAEIKRKSDQERRERLAKERGLEGPHQLPGQDKKEKQQSKQAEQTATTT